jgi:3-oxoacyl-[acyl-carrier-protein] synthase-3
MTAVYLNNIVARLPNEPVDNDQMESILGQVGDRPSRARRAILRSNGIKSRHYAIDPVNGEPTHSNAELTAETIRLLENDEFDLASMDCLACGTSMPDQLMPNHAVMVHGELATPPCEVVATSGVCVAGMTAMKYAWLGVASGEFTNAVATGSEVASAVMRGNRFAPEIATKVQAQETSPEIAFEKDFLRWMLSDGAGAVLLQSSPKTSGLSLRIDWIYERSFANEMSACMYSGAEKRADGRLVGWNEYAPEEWLENSIFAVKQDVKQLNEHVIHYTVERPLLELAEKKGIRPDQIDFFLPHYSSEFFRDRVYEGMRGADFDIPFDRWFTNLRTKGNTGSAAIYIIIEELYRSGLLEGGQKLLCYIPESGRFSSAYMLMTVFDPDTMET